MSAHPDPTKSQAKMHEVFKDRLGGYTSDHAAQNMEVTETENGGKTTTLRLKTWNMLGQCKAPQKEIPPDLKTGYPGRAATQGNNPFAIDETLEQFYARRKIQYATIIKELREATKTGKQFDCVFLQEANELAFGEVWNKPNPPSEPGKDASDKDKDKYQKKLQKYLDKLTEYEKEYKDFNELKKQFHEELKSLGFEIHTTDRELGCKPLVTIRNINTLQLRDEKGEAVSEDNEGKKAEVKGEGVFPVPAGEENQQKTGFLLPVLKDGKPIDLINLHASYTEDYKREILNRQFEGIKKGVTVVMGGDLNHAPSHNDMVGMMANPKHSSNFDSANPQNRQAGDPLTLKDLRNEAYKAYDGFFMSPGAKDSFVEAVEMQGKYFDINSTDQTKVLLKDKNEFQKFTLSDPSTGRPWIDPKYWEKLIQAGVISKTQAGYHLHQTRPLPATEITQELKIIAKLRAINREDNGLISKIEKEFSYLPGDLDAAKLERYIKGLSQQWEGNPNDPERHLLYKPPAKDGQGSILGTVLYLDPASKAGSKPQEIAVLSSEKIASTDTDQINIKFPIQPTGQLNLVQTDWTVKFLQDISREEELIAVANGFKREDLVRIMQQIDANNRTDSNKIYVEIQLGAEYKADNSLQEYVIAYNANIRAAMDKKALNPLPELSKPLATAKVPTMKIASRGATSPNV